MGASEPGANAPGFSETGPSGLLPASGAKCGPRGLVVLARPCPRLPFRPETPFSGSPEHSHCHDPFCRGMVQNRVPRNRPPNRPTARHIFAAGNARETRIRAPEAVPEFTANAFADHHRRIRLAALRQPKTMDSLRCSDGMPSTAPHFASNDKALAPTTFSVLGLTPARPPLATHRALPACSATPSRAKAHATTLVLGTTTPRATHPTTSQFPAFHNPYGSKSPTTPTQYPHANCQLPTAN